VTEGVAEGPAEGVPDEAVSTGVSLAVARPPVDAVLVHPVNASRTTGTTVPIRPMCATPSSQSPAEGHFCPGAHVPPGMEMAGQTVDHGA
jgi:hypothetical protein